MTPWLNSTKKYEQPYSSRCVTRNVEDSIRVDEAPYIKNFPYFLHLVYEKQTPFKLELLPYIGSRNRPPSNSKRSQSGKVSPAKQASQPNSFRTMGQEVLNEKSPTSPMPTVPSDFEHIFHYSEAE